MDGMLTLPTYKEINQMKPKYNKDGMRMTDCCGCVSTYDDGDILYCKGCFKPVPNGQGDGSEYKKKDEE